MQLKRRSRAARSAYLVARPIQREAGLVPGSYFSYQLNALNPNIWLGLSINAPFALSASFPDVWAGRDYGAHDSNVRSYNAAPSIAWRINDWISLGAGVQIQYFKATLNKGISLPGPTFTDFTLEGDGWGYGFTAGVTLTPTPTTTIGIGYRSAIDQKVEGTIVLTGPLAGFSNLAKTTVDLPDVVSARNPSAYRPAAYFARHCRVDELEPNRDLQRIIAIWRAGYIGGRRGYTAVPIRRRLVLLGRQRISVERQADAPQRYWVRDFADHRSGPHTDYPRQ